MIEFKPTATAIRHTKKLYDLEHHITKGIRKALFEIGFKGARDSADMIHNDNKTGKIYLRNEIPHTASAPGQAPANMTGKLKRSYGYHVRGYHEVEVGNRLHYARFLELGTRRIEPRPVLYKVASNSQALALDLLEDHTKNAFK